MSRRMSCPPYEGSACPDRIVALEQAMRGEAGAIRFYTILAEMTPDQEQKNTIFRIRNDERRHLNNFQAVYCRLTGHTYAYPEPAVNVPPSYCAGLQMSFADEQEAYEFYKLNYLCNSSPMVRNVFQDAMLDEAEHARWFNNLLIRNDCD
ncbi:MAG: ferritin family protein [Ignavibacteriales bacterium]